MDEWFIFILMRGLNLIGKKFGKLTVLSRDVKTPRKEWVHKDINLMKQQFSTEKLVEYSKLIVAHNIK
jgi:hypothetical protein